MAKVQKAGDDQMMKDLFVLLCALMCSDVTELYEAKVCVADDSSDNAVKPRHAIPVTEPESADAESVSTRDV